MALQFVGMKGDKATVFSPEELGQWIVDKVRKRAISLQNAKKCAEYVLAHDGKGGGIGQKLEGKHSIFHISHGKMNGSDGCTTFFSTREGKHAIIVGIGWHRTQTSYDLDFKKGDWNQAKKTLVQL